MHNMLREVLKSVLVTVIETIGSIYAVCKVYTCAS